MTDESRPDLRALPTPPPEPPLKLEMASWMDGDTEITVGLMPGQELTPELKADLTARLTKILAEKDDAETLSFPNDTPVEVMMDAVMKQARREENSTLRSHIRAVEGET